MKSTEAVATAAPKPSHLASIITLDPADWHKLAFWRNMFIYFWVFSLLGHFLEMAWALAGSYINLGHTPDPATMQLIVFAAPYGLGAVALRLLIYPYVQQKRMNLLSTYVLSVIITSTIEFICAAAVVLFMGSNPFWNYSDEPFNLFGFICLRNSLAFGIASTIAIKFIFPPFDNILRKIDQNVLNIAFWAFLAIYVVVQGSQLIK